MTYNIHPIFVHFPIALLLVYSIIKIIPFQKWFPKFAWKDVQVVLLVVGVLGAFAALATGDTAEHLVRPNRALVEAHSTFATIATWLYVALLLGEIAHFWNNHAAAVRPSYAGIKKVTTFIAKYLRDSFTAKGIAFIALIAISVAGLLGGVIAYGTTADPIAGYVLSILGITI